LGGCNHRFVVRFEEVIFDNICKFDSFLLWLVKNNVTSMILLSFVYNRGSFPGTRREASLLGNSLLKDGSPAFRAFHDGRPKLYNMNHVSELYLVEEEEKRFPEKTKYYWKLLQYMRLFHKEKNIEENVKIIPDKRWPIRFTPFPK